MKKNTRKLRLTRETLRSLTDQSLGAAVGGASATTACCTSPTLCDTNCTTCNITDTCRCHTNLCQ